MSNPNRNPKTGEYTHAPFPTPQKTTDDPVALLEQVAQGLREGRAFEYADEDEQLLSEFCGHVCHHEEYEKLYRDYETSFKAANQAEAHGQALKNFLRSEKRLIDTGRDIIESQDTEDVADFVDTVATMTEQGRAPTHAIQYLVEQAFPYVDPDETGYEREGWEDTDKLGVLRNLFGHGFRPDS